MRTRHVAAVVAALSLFLVTASAWANRCESVSAPGGEQRLACVSGSDTWVIRSFDDPSMALAELSAFTARPANKWGDNPRNAVMLTDASVTRQWMVISREFVDAWHYGDEPWRVSTFTDKLQATTFYEGLSTRTRKMMELPDGLWGVAYMTGAEAQTVRSRAITRP